MPVQGSVPRTTQEQVVPPFQETVKKALTVIDQPQEQQEVRIVPEQDYHGCSQYTDHRRIRDSSKMTNPPL